MLNKNKIELEELVNDYGGSIVKSNKKSQVFHDAARQVLNHFDTHTYKDIELFAEYLKEVGKLTTVHFNIGLDPSLKPENF
ncbi:MAG: hypothetical protein CMB97_00950 [Flavobacteriaceae bacterium]|jgi:hypothetical protein|nr:hypothetical protein [Flavobacteriaceae bacterium]